mmetsp:Transcript_19296/g.22390  ORF Transcript_19296/g.22390 Transcript_19296/m.22390 type:complete len:174 (-) Transcript_19296:66-587(-)
MKQRDQRIHLVLYFVSPFKPIKKFDIFAMMKIQKYAHIIPVIGQAEKVQPEELRLCKLDLISMAHLNNVKFFDVYESLLLKDKEAEYSNIKHFMESEEGPCPPFSANFIPHILSVCSHAIKQTNTITAFAKEDSTQERKSGSRNEELSTTSISLLSLTALAGGIAYANLSKAN